MLIRHKPPANSASTSRCDTPTTRRRYRVAR